MYSLFFNGAILDDARLEGYQVREPQVHLAVNEPGSISFVIDNDHPHLNLLQKMKGVLELREEAEVIYRGRITQETRDFDLSREIESEGMLACLNDSVIPPFSFPDDFINSAEYNAAATSGNVVEFFLNWILSLHNSQVTDEQKILLGNVTVTDSNNYITRESSDYNTAWSVIQDKLFGSSLGGYFLIRYEENGNYVDYLSALPGTNLQPVKFGENLLDLLFENNAANIFTVALPVGAEGLKITEYPDGEIDEDIVKLGDTLYSATAIQAYGKITRVLKFDDVTQLNNLVNKAVAELRAAGLAQTITVKACDLHFESAESFRVGRYTLLSSPPHDFAAVYPLTTLDIDIKDAGNTEITFGNTAISQTGFNKEATAKAAERADAQQIEINKSISDLSAYVRRTEFQDYQAAQSAQLATLSGEISGVSTDLQTKYNERIRYIRFDGDSIYIGLTANEAEIKIEETDISLIKSDKTIFSYSATEDKLTFGEASSAFDFGGSGLSLESDLSLIADTSQLSSLPATFAGSGFALKFAAADRQSAFYLLADNAGALFTGFEAAGVITWNEK